VSRGRINLIKLLGMAGLLLWATCTKVDKKDEGNAGPKPPAGEQAGEVTAVLSVGTASSAGVQVLTGAAAGKWQTQKVGQPLPYGQPLRTRKGARARLVLKSGDVLHLDEATRVVLQGQGLLKLQAGQLLAEVRSSARGGKPLRIETPAGKVKVSGTKLQVSVEGATTSVVVTRGQVEVEGAGARVAVGAGERALLRKGQAPRVSLGRDLAHATRWAREVNPPTVDARGLRPGFGSLTARAPGQGGGRPLQLRRHQVRVVIRDNVARTEIEQSYYNPTGQTLEGTYRFPLPPDASISRLALYVGNRLEEGEIVERRRARQIFRQIVQDTIRPRDPALLEWMGGRSFRMKIFPIPPRASRRVILAYTQPLSASFGRHRYVYPMASAGKSTRIGRFSIELSASSSLGLERVEAPLYPVLGERKDGSLRLRYEASDFVPAASFVVDLTPKGTPPELQLALYERPDKARKACAIKARQQEPAVGRADPCGDRGGFFMAVLRPELPLSGRATARDYLFLMDSSHSTGKRGWALQVAALEAFLSEMDLRSRFTVMACDATCKTWRTEARKPTAEARRQALAFARAVTPGGSSNLQVSFHEAAGRAAAMGSGVRVVYIGDGRPTAGELREPELAGLVVDQLRQAGASLDVLQVGEDTGEQFLALSTRRLAGAVHRITAGDDVGSRVFEIVASHYRPTLTDLELSFEGELETHHVYPRTLSSVTAGGELVLVGRYGRGGQGAIRLRGKLQGRAFNRRYPVDLTAGAEEQRANAFVPRIWARQHLEALTADGYDRNRPEIVRVSKAYTVMSKATAFLVLENERMYREFGVKRKRQRNYWKGDKVATRKGADQPRAEAAGRAGAGAGSPLGQLASSAGAGRATGGTTSDISGAPGPLAGAEREEEKRTSRRRSLDMADDLIDGLASGDPDKDAPAAEPAPAATAAPPPARPAKAARPRPRMSRPDLGKLVETLPDRPRRRRATYHWITVRKVAVEPLLALEPSGQDRAAEARLKLRARAAPLRRGIRQAYHRRLMHNGRYALAARHALKWAELDGRHHAPLRALGDALAAGGKAAEATRSYTSMVEVRPYSATLHRRLAGMYRNKGDLRRACAHLWSVMSLRPSDVARQLELARCLAAIPGEKQTAIRILSDVASRPEGRRQAARITRALAAINDGAVDSHSPRTSGAVVVRATWSRPVDLDLALITPRGERISALMAGRRGGVEQDSHDGLTQEVLRLGWAAYGSYRVEIAAPEVPDSDKPISGTLLVRAHGKSRTIPFVLASRSKPLASIKITHRRIRRRMVAK
jgi:hypothetical protein